MGEVLGKCPVKRLDLWLELRIKFTRCGYALSTTGKHAQLPRQSWGQGHLVRRDHCRKEKAAVPDRGWEKRHLLLFSIRA